MKRRGFTLIELLVVIAIIGILAAAALIALSRSQAKARDATRKQDLAQVRKVLETYQIDNPGTYPTASGLVDMSTIATDLAPQLSGSALPEDPQKASRSAVYKYANAYTTATDSAWTKSSDTHYYTIMALLEAPQYYITNPTKTDKIVFWHVNSTGASFENPNHKADGTFDTVTP